MAFFGWQIFKAQSALNRLYSRSFSSWRPKESYVGRDRRSAKVVATNHGKPSSRRANELRDLAELSRSNEWRRAINVIESRNVKCDIDTLLVYNTITAKAFEEGDFYLGRMLLNDILGKRFNPHCDVFIAYWRACSAHQTKFRENIESMLQFIGSNAVVVSQAVVDNLNAELCKFGGGVTNANVDPNGQCDVCSNRLQPNTLTNSELGELRTEFREVLVRAQIGGGDVQALQRLVNKNKRYDVVIDALNVIMVNGLANYDQYNQAYILRKLLDYLKYYNKKALIIGRNYMNQWPDRHLQHIHRNATLFCTSSTDDDLLTLHAAFSSGPKTDIISNDLYSDHRYKFGSKTAELFERWQKQHQHHFTYDNETKRCRVHQPSVIYAITQTDDGHWHIPCTDHPLMTRPLIYTDPIRWCCAILAK